MNTKNIFKKILSLILAVSFMSSLITLTPVYAEEPTPISHEVDLNKYIVLDLAKGSITITATGYTGYEWKADATEAVLVTNGANTTNKPYYIIQSTDTITASVSGTTLKTPAYADIPDVVNQTDVADVATAWDTDATAKGRTFTENFITVTASNNLNVTVVLDDVWSSEARSSVSSIDGGFVFDANGFTGAHVKLLLRGDNRMSNVFYSSKATGTTNSLTFDSFDSTNDNHSKEGSLTVIGDQNKISYTNANAVTKATCNHWAAVIGGNDGSQGQARGLVFAGGTVYAGAGIYENCGAIGGGGNDYGDITISGGIVTAVAHTTAATIGGGIGHRSAGGKATVNITGGKTYAYNFGVKAKGYVTEYGDANATQQEKASHIPGAAIGGGSSIISSGNEAWINISGGTVYAESLGGCAIGGGSSVVSTGGVGHVTITGGNVTARSTGDVLDFPLTDESEAFPVSASTAIGGGFSAMKEGGDTNVTVSGGTIVSDGIGGGFSDTYGYSDGTVVITGGTLNSEISAIPTNGASNGNKQVYLTRASFILTNNVMKEKAVSAISTTQTNYYGLTNVQTDDLGMIYVWLPEDDALQNATIEGTQYTAAFESDRLIHSKDIGALASESDKHFIVNISSSEFYELTYNQESKDISFNGTMLVPQGSFTYKIHTTVPNISLTPYVESVDTNGEKILIPGKPLTKINDTTYQASLDVTSDRRIWYEITINGETYFTHDLTNGDITVTQAEDGSFTITQDGYTRSGYKGALYLTSNGHPTSSNITVDIDKGKEIEIYINKITASSTKPVMDIQSGIANVTFGQADNIIQSQTGPAISIGNDAKLALSTDGSDSLKLNGGSGSSDVQGSGTVQLVDKGGFLKIDDNKNGIPQFAVGSYIYQGSDPKYTANLHDGSGLPYEVIGYIGPDNKLHSKEDIANDNHQNFYGCGLYAALTGVEFIKTDDILGYEIEDGNLLLYLKLKETDQNQLDTPYILGEDNQPIEITLTVDDTNAAANRYIVTIPGEAFSINRTNIRFMAAAQGLIAFSIQNYEGKYDGNDHSITVIVDQSKFDVYYSLNSLDESNYSTGQTTNIVIKDVTGSAKEVYVYIVPKETSTNYEKFANGQYGTINITIGDNEWIKKLNCPDVVVGNVPKATAEAKWNTGLTFEYYDSNGTPLSEEALKNLAVGEYYVIAKVPEAKGKYGYNNYEALTTDKYYFKVIQVIAYAVASRQLDPVAATVGTVDIVPNGAFTVYYNTSIQTENPLRFSRAIPIGTKITMIAIDPNNENRPLYYYYIAETDILQIELTNFCSMGTNTKFTSLENRHYQFAIDHSEVEQEKLNSESMQVSFGSHFATVTFNAAKNSATFESLMSSNEKITAKQENEIVKVMVKPVATGTLNKILAFKIDSTNTLGDKITVTLKTDTGASRALTYAANGFYYYQFDPSYSLNSEYEFAISGLQPGNYTITADIRMMDTVEEPYVLNGKEDEINHLTTTVEVESYFPTYFYVNQEGSRVIQPSAESLSFITNIQNGNIEAKLQWKTPNGYQDITNNAISCTVTNYNFTIDISKIAGYFANLTAPTVIRIVFTYDGIICNHNIIVTPFG